MSSPKNTTSLDALVADIRKGLATIEQVLPYLPPDLRERYGRVADQLRSGLENVAHLHEQGRTDGAVALAEETWRIFRQENPLRAIVEDSLETFEPLVTSILPPLELVENLARVTVHLGGLVYDLWKARALRMPFSPAVVPLVLDDDTTGLALIAESPTFSQAFRDEIAARGPSFTRTVAERYLLDGDIDWLWEDFSDQFNSEDEFRSGAEEFHAASEDVIMARIDMRLREMVESSGVETSAGYDTLVAAIDRLRDDEDGAARLDALLTVFEALHRGGGRLPSVLEKVKNELGAEASA